MIDLSSELTAWLRSPAARAAMKEIVTEAIHTEVAKAHEELLDVDGAAAVLAMSAGALRKAVERGQVPCQRIGSRLRFRRLDLLAQSPATPRKARRLDARGRPRAKRRELELAA